jgi:hypothetical protein
LTPKKWISQLKTGQKMSKKQSVKRSGPQQLFYTEAFKQKIVNEVLNGKLSKRQAQSLQTNCENQLRLSNDLDLIYWNTC